jgi:demethoxyubiquinone hydroxylase (CLK1/Coq7/Cat5 family)
MNIDKANEKIIDQLNSFLRGEISAVETYRMARDRVSVVGPQGEIDQCMRSHEERVQALTSRIVALGGEPARSSGLWGAFAKVVEGGAALLGESTAIAVLEEGEDHGVRDYRSALDKNDELDVSIRAFVGELLEKQLRTHAVMSNLKKVGKHAAAH